MNMVKRSMFNDVDFKRELQRNFNLLPYHTDRKLKMKDIGVVFTVTGGDALQAPLAMYPLGRFA